MPYSFSMSNTASNVLISTCINKLNQPNNPLIFHNSCHKATADTLVTKAHFSCHDTPVERWLLVSIWVQLFPTVSQYILIFSFTISIRYISIRFLMFYLDSFSFSSLQRFTQLMFLMFFSLSFLINSEK